MSKVQIYHNPRCSKSRQTLALLQERDLDVEIIEYLKQPPSVARLDHLCKALGMQPNELVRRKEKLFKELGLSASDPKTRREWLQILSEHPVLIERPIVLSGKKAALGRPPENVLAIL